MNYRIYVALFFLSSYLPANAQVGGGSIYQFLNIAAAARPASMGGTFISVKDNDLNLALQNPSLLNPSMDGSIAFGGVSYFSDVKLGDAAFALDKKKAGTFMASIHYIDYGSFLETDNTAEIIGNFSAAEYAISVGWAHPINEDSSFTVGAQARFIYSHLYSYYSSGLVGDISATYYDRERQWTVALVGRNLGSQLKEYTIGVHEPVPMEVIAAVSKRLAHVPFRFNLTLRNLQKWDISYIDPATATTIDPITNEAVTNEISFGNKLMRHVILGGEILLSKNFHLRVAYNGQRKNEMGLETASSMAGWSFGFGLKIYHFQLSYGRAIYSIAGGSDHFSITTNIHDFIN